MKKTIKKKINVLVFSWFYDPFIGGAEIFLEELVSRLKTKCDFEIITARLDSKLPKKEVRGNVTIHRVGIGNKIDKFTYILLAPLKALTIKNVDLVHAIIENAAAFSAMVYLWFRKKPSVLNMQSGDSDEYTKRYLTVFFPIYKKIFKAFDFIHCLSSFLYTRAMNWGADKEKVEIIPNGVNLELFDRKRLNKTKLKDIRKKLQISSGQKVLITVSRLAMKNGVGDLIKSLQDLDENVVLLVVGTGELEDELKNLTKSLKLEKRVKFLGHVDYKDVSYYLCNSDIFIRPSISESFGNVFVEALACDIPIIGTPVGGIVDFLEEGKTGLFCKAEDPKSIAKAVERLLKDDKLCKSIVKDGKKMVLKKYSWGVICKKVYDIYTKVLRK